MHKKTNPRSTVHVFFLFLFLKTRTFLGADIISSDQSLSEDQTIVSASGIFVLGFFTPGTSSNYYLGMWYKDIAPQTVVWVANRDKPVSERFSSELRISHGNLVLFDESKFPIWSTNVNSRISSPLIKAVLLDNGNLVLKDGSNLSKPSLWESFDHPTDTWLPGSKLGYNKKTHEKILLTSWRSPEDPAPGLFTLEPFPSDNSYVVQRNKSNKVWSSGAWDEKLGSFSLTPEMKVNRYFNFSHVSNDNESYLTYTVFSTSYGRTRFVMHVSGQISELILMPNREWHLYSSQPTQQCQVYAACGAYGSCDENSMLSCSCLSGFEPKLQSDWDLEFYSDGCIRQTKLQCGNNNSANGKRDRFLKMPTMSLPKNEQFVQVENIISCESACLNNCSCTAYSFNSSGCSIWMGDLLDLQQLKAAKKMGRTLYIRLAASEF